MYFSNQCLWKERRQILGVGCQHNPSGFTRSDMPGRGALQSPASFMRSISTEPMVREPEL